jgi:hypothetical protein
MRSTRRAIVQTVAALVAGLSTVYVVLMVLSVRLRPEVTSADHFAISLAALAAGILAGVLAAVLAGLEYPRQG